jgi:hypothetical protein
MFDRGNQESGRINGLEIPEQLSNCSLYKKDSDTTS